MPTAQEPSELLETDPFDPAVLDAHAKAVQEKEGSSDAEVRQWLERRRIAYARVFTPGEREQGDIDIVLTDLMWFCKQWVSTYDIKDGIHADVLDKMKQGRREVFQRIKDFSRLDSDMLLLKYTDAIKPK